MKPSLTQSILIPCIFFFSSLGLSVHAQNITPQPSPFSLQNVATPRPKPTPIFKMPIPMQRFGGTRVEFVTKKRIVFSNNDKERYSTNRSLYYWDFGGKQLIDTGEDGISGSIRAPQDGRYMLFLFDEYDANRDINGDRIYQTVLRMFHFDTRQVVNVGTPARSATPRPDETRYEFEVILDDHLLLFSNDEDGRNTDTNLDAPWYAVNMLEIIYKIEGTPTPTPSPSPIPTPTLPEFTPTPTPINPVDPATRARSDINQDGRIDAQDLLIFQLDWKADRLLME